MSMTLCPAIHLYQKDVLGAGDPSSKITPAGFLQYLLTTGQNRELSNVVNTGNGTFNNAVVKYTPRTTAANTGTSDDCTVDLAAYDKNYTVPSTSYFRKIAFVLDADTVKGLCAGEATWVNKGGLSLWEAFWKQLETAANGLIQGINLDLLTKQGLNFGKNKTTGLTTPKTLNFPLSTATLNLSQGLPMLLTDMELNEVCAPIDIVGSGLFQSFDNAQLLACCNAAGIDTTRWNYTLYKDYQANTVWGANEIGIFERGSVQLITYAKNRLNLGKHGATEYGILPLTIPSPACNGDYPGLDFNFTLRWVDCAEQINIGGAEEPTTIKNAYIAEMSLAYDLVHIPADAYDPADPLTGVNGTFNYVVTNA